jgi:hypothetical protein
MRSTQIRKNRIAARKRNEKLQNFALGVSAAIGFLAVLAYPYAQALFF